MTVPGLPPSMKVKNVIIEQRQQHGADWTLRGCAKHNSFGVGRRSTTVVEPPMPVSEVCRREHGNQKNLPERGILIPFVPARGTAVHPISANASCVGKPLPDAPCASAGNRDRHYANPFMKRGLDVGSPL